MSFRWFRKRTRRKKTSIKKLTGSPYTNIPRWLYEKTKRVKTNVLNPSKTTKTKEKKINVPNLQRTLRRLVSTVNKLIDEVNKIIHMPDTCPNCGKNMYDNEVKLNKKFWKTHGTCFDCVVTMETRLRAEGKYEEYERKKMYENAKSFFATADKEVEIVKEALKDKLEFVQNAQGDVEEFDQSDYKEKYLKYIDEQYNRFKQETLVNLKTNKNK